MKSEEFRKAVSEGQIEWRKHVLERLAERGIKQEEIINVLLTGENIEDYPEDTPYPSVLVLGFSSGQPFHVVASFDESKRIAYIITAYRPSLEYFEEGFRKRRKK